ncbi:MAG TPA: tape measure protein, partial [Crocinitomicaceae bacterium]|nr:tape measure protein [Crocinitomicaceae bacterium]
MGTGTSKLQLIIDLANKMFNTKLKETQDKFTKATNNMMGKAKQLKMENAKAFGAMSDQFPALQRGMDLLTNKYVLMAGAAAGIGVLAGKAIKLGIEDEMQRTSFEVMLGGKKAAENIVNDIADYAAKTPYEKLGLGKAAQTMLGFGIAQEKIMPNLKMLGDVAMGDAQKLESLSLAFAQISSAGKLQGQDLMQLINAGFNPLAEISK